MCKFMCNLQYRILVTQLIFEYTGITHNIWKSGIIDNQAEFNQIEKESLTIPSHQHYSETILLSQCSYNWFMWLDVSEISVIISNDWSLLTKRMKKFQDFVCYAITFGKEFCKLIKTVTKFHCLLNYISR